MKKVLILILMLINTLTLSGCNIDLQSEKEYDPHDFYPKQEIIYTKETAMKILECFDSMDADSLINMFSESVKNKYNLKEHIESAFEIYGGKSVSKGVFENDGYSSSGSRDGEYVEKSIRAQIYNIKTDNNETFTIWFTKCVLDDDNLDNIGLHDIYLIDLEYGTLAKIGRVDDQDIRLFEEHNQKRNAAKGRTDN